MKKFTLFTVFLLFVCGQLSAKVLYAEASLKATYGSINYGKLSVPVMYDADAGMYIFPGFLGLISESETANIAKSDKESTMWGVYPIFTGAFVKNGQSFYILNDGVGQTNEFINDADGSVSVLENVRFYFPHCLIREPSYGYNNPQIMMELYADVLTTKEGVTMTRKILEVILNIVLPTDEEFAGIDQINYDDSVAPAEYYNLQGVRVNEPQPGNIYIRRQGNRSTKVRF